MIALIIQGMILVRVSQQHLPCWCLPSDNLVGWRHSTRKGSSQNINKVEGRVLAPGMLPRQKAVTRPDRPVVFALWERTEKWKMVSLPFQQIQGLVQNFLWLCPQDTGHPVTWRRIKREAVCESSGKWMSPSALWEQMGSAWGERMEVGRIINELQMHQNPLEVWGKHLSHLLKICCLFFPVFDGASRKR